MAADLFLNLMPKDLVLLERGFPAYWLFNLILDFGPFPAKDGEERQVVTPEGNDKFPSWPEFQKRTEKEYLGRLLEKAGGSRFPENWKTVFLFSGK